jgi:hypothetical protein
MMRLQIVQLKNKSGFAILWGLVIAVFLTILGSAAIVRSQSYLKEVNHRIALQRAFYAAESGIDRVIFELRRDVEWRPDSQGGETPLNIQGQVLGFYSLKIAAGDSHNGWNTLWIKSIGQDDLKTVRRAIVAKVIVESPSRFLVSTLGSLYIGSGASLDGDILARDIFFEVNETLASPQKDITVRGINIYYLHSINGLVNQAGEDISAVDHTGSNISSFDSITFPGVDVVHYQELAHARVPEGEAVEVDGDLSVDLSDLEKLNTLGLDAFNPKLIFASGDVTISGEYSNSILVVAGKNLYITGAIKPDADAAGSPQIGLFAKKDVIIPADVTTTGGDLAVEAMVMADGDGDDSDGNFRAAAGIFSLGTLNFYGSIAVRGQGRTGVDLNAFSTRIYNYNPELNQHRDIPFMPFIVDIVRWQEVPPASAFPPPD